MIPHKSLLLVLAFTATAHADNYLIRTPENPALRLDGQIHVGADVSYSGSVNGERYSGTETTYVPIRLTVDVDGKATLRPGEREVFWVRAWESGSSQVFGLKMKAVHRYEVLPGSAPELSLEKDSVRVVPQIAVRLKSLGRIATTPPNVVANMRWSHAAADAALTIAFQDPGDADDGGAVTTYHVTVVRQRPLWPDKKIAEGTVEGTDTADQAFVVIPQGQNHVSDEFLKPGSSYKVTFRLTKAGPDYTGDESEGRDFTVKYHGPSNIETAPLPEASADRSRFETLHAE